MHLKGLTWRMCSFVILVSAYLASGARRGGIHALQYAQMTTVCEGKSSPNFWIDVFQTGTASNEGNEAPRCGGAEEISMSCCMREAMETAQFLWRQNICGGLYGQSGRQSTDYALIGSPLCRWEGSVAH